MKFSDYINEDLKVKDFEILLKQLTKIKQDIFKLFNSKSCLECGLDIDTPYDCIKDHIQKVKDKIDELNKGKK